MKKGKNWLLHEITKLPCEVQSGHVKIKVVDVLPLIDQLEDSDNLEESKKVVIPRFVADWIEEMKQDERPLYNVMSSLTNKRSHEWTIWKRANMNFSEIVAKAWLEGYQVEKEKLYYVVNGAQQLILVNIGHIVPSFTDFEIAERAGILKKYQLTEKEIKKYDARYWSFAVEVAE